MGPSLAVDATSIFAFGQFLEAQRFTVQNPNYEKLDEALQTCFSTTAFDPKLAFVAVSLEHEGQKKFSSFLQHHLGYIVDATDYRDAFILPDRTSQYQRLSTRITYVAGMLAAKRPHLVVVTDGFDVYYPLCDFVRIRGGKVSLAFFRSGLEARWQRVGLFDEDSPITFVDLDPYAKSIFGVDLVSLRGGVAPKTGLASLRI